MKKCVLWLSVVVVLCFAAGVLFAQEGTKERLPQAYGVVKSVDTEAKTIVVTVRKEREGEGTDTTFQTNEETKIFVGKEAKTLADITVGSRVVITYKKAEGEGKAIAITIKTLAPKTEGGEK